MSENNTDEDIPNVQTDIVFNQAETIKPNVLTDEEQEAIWKKIESLSPGETFIDQYGNSYEKAPRNGIFDITDTGPNGGRYANVQAIETVTGDIIIQRTMLLG
jgi:hypothetical protein